MVVRQAVAVQGLGYGRRQIAVRGLRPITVGAGQEFPNFTGDFDLAVVDTAGFIETPVFDFALVFTLAGEPAGTILFTFASSGINYVQVDSLVGELLPASPRLQAVLAQAEADSHVSAEALVATESGITKVTLTGTANAVIRLLEAGGAIDAVNGSRVVSFQEEGPMIHWEVDP